MNTFFCLCSGDLYLYFSMFLVFTEFFIQIKFDFESFSLLVILSAILYPAKPLFRYAIF